MPSTRLSQREREAVLAKVKPTGPFKSPKERRPFGNEPIPWETRLGDLDEFRKNPGQLRVIAPKLANPAKTDSVRTSIVNRLRKLYPNESWATTVDESSILLRYNGLKRSYADRSQGQTREGTNNSDDNESGGLFASAM